MTNNFNPNKSVGNAYGKHPAKVEDIHPVKLIYLLYERAISHVEDAEKSIENNDLKRRGESLSKAFAIVTELNASIKKDDNSNAAKFLRTLYSAILSELPRVSVTGELQDLQLAHSYLDKLKDIWEDSAMVEVGLRPEKSAVDKAGVAEKTSHEPKKISVDV